MKSVALRSACLAGLMLLLASPAFAGSINVGSNWLLPNTPNQVIPIFVSGNETVFGTNFRVAIGDGFPDSGIGVDGPNITNVDLWTGTIFATSGNNQTNPTSLPQVWESSFIVDTGQQVTLSGVNQLLATLTVDTTGFTTGTWTLDLAQVAGTGLDTELLNGGGNPIGSFAITNGTVSVPEPSSMVLAGLVSGVAFAGRAWRRRREVKKSA